MERMPTAAAEEIYAILVRYASASEDHYESEGFIYAFGVMSDGPERFKLTVTDGNERFFIKTKKSYKMEGKGSAKVNSIVKHILAKHATSRI